MATLSAPTSSALKSSHRTRGHSAMDFKSATTGVAAKSMKNELNKMASDIKDPANKRVRLTVISSLSSLPENSLLKQRIML
ncbi:UTP-glucose-1-phosphate uridylyltransferase [Serendipita sp. 397]|nr:UTP-glucose-1-phosphate uridylyltransferase [Serendipita sp. 397]